MSAFRLESQNGILRLYHGAESNSTTVVFCMSPDSVQQITDERILNIFKSQEWPRKDKPMERVLMRGVGAQKRKFTG